MAKRDAVNRTVQVGDVCRALERIAPLHLAQEWDNVGLLAGDNRAPVRRMLLCIDLTGAVVTEALRAKIDLVMAYHPPIFKPVDRLVAQGGGADAHVFRCVAAGVAVYSMHTALDAAEGGTNDTLARLCGIEQTEPMVYAAVGPDRCKLVTFVPPDQADAVAQACFSAGAGHIGDYEMCSYSVAGCGTFKGGQSTRPAVGRAGRYETVEELRLETVTPKSRLPQVIQALRRAHPYEEPAFDVYPLEAEPVRGIGRVGRLPRSITLAALARKLRRVLPAPCTLVVGQPDIRVERALICVGSAGSLPFSWPLQAGDVIVTGEIRHHDALTLRRSGCCAIALSHWASERPGLVPLAQRLARMLPRVKVSLSKADADPFAKP
ncbi:MAG: Nif3-like dinuclear metal center hexameric protein [Phycisphaerae bacterium]